MLFLVSLRLKPGVAAAGTGSCLLRQHALCFAASQTRIDVTSATAPGPLVLPGAVPLAPGLLCWAGRALSTVTTPGPLVLQGLVPPGPGHSGPGGQEPVTLCWSLPVRSAVLSHHPLAGVRRCPLVMGLGLSAGLLVGVSGCRPVSPLSFSPIVQWGGIGLARWRVDHQQHW